MPNNFVAPLDSINITYNQLDIAKDDNWHGACSCVGIGEFLANMRRDEMFYASDLGRSLFVSLGSVFVAATLLAAAIMPSIVA